MDITEDDMIFVGAILSFICSAALFITWCLIPQWRTVLNYVMVNQIIAGAFQLSCDWPLSKNLSEEADNILMSIKLNLFLASMCWSLCACMISYLKLVLIHPGKISLEKRKATVFSCGVFILIKFVTSYLIPQTFQLTEIGSMIIVILLFYFIISLNMFTFVKVVITVILCCKKRISKFQGSNIISLIGVCFICDFVTTLCLLLTLVPSENVNIRVVMAFRLLPQALVVLFNRRSRYIWSKYLRKRVNRRMNNIVMQNYRH